MSGRLEALYQLETLFLTPMNSRLSKVATVRASHLPNRLYRCSNTQTSVTISDWLTWFEVLGYTVRSHIEMRAEGNEIEQGCHDKGVLQSRLYKALKRINPTVLTDVLEIAISKVTKIKNSNLFENNHCFHKFLIEGIDVRHQYNGQLVYDKVWLIDPLHLLNNDWLVTYQSELIGNSFVHSFDVTIFINGLPLALIVDTTFNKKALLKPAYQKIQFYKQQHPTPFSFNTFLIITSGKQARVGTLTSSWEEFFPWHTIDGEDFTDDDQTELEILIQGLFDKRRFFEIIKNCIVFEQKISGNNKYLFYYPFCTIPYYKR